ncbi:hypothetical protein WOSG25_110170 [Weissella oryzae SG25]|uniref:Uncharacterized protein n=1 Tax=Weissella oryzae (strain DSM 25784 / JCM 18191 / LMG 30913 / SG25) TaxID=1329250 RepID=A0A069CVM6_WEIOS|nr:hypothetical protein [Weissella oryzae]GAK31539.1 hypothetical protein WOSG25_110170 [Weissella oryzae SG25]
MFRDMFKRHPTTLEDPYYAVIKPGSLDIDNYTIKNAIETALDLEEHWPMATLQELTTFLATLKNDLVLQNHIVEMESIEFMYDDSDQGVISTGLAWDNVKLDYDFKNFVVSTVSSTLNDRETRLDEHATYSLISQSLFQLISFSQELTDLSADDMPILPTEKQYDEALSNDTDLLILPRRLVSSDQSDNEPLESTTSPSEGQPVEPSEDTDNGNDNFFSFGEDESNNETDNSGSKPQFQNNGVVHLDAPVQTTVLGGEGLTNDDTSSKDTVTPKPKVDLTTESQLNHVKLVAPQFNLASESMPKNIVAEAENYVEAKLFYDKVDANEFLQTTADQLLEATKLKLSNAIKAEDDNFYERQQAILNSSWQEDFITKTRSKIHAEFMEQSAKENSSLEKSRDAKLKAEEERHQREIETINSKFAVDKEALELKLLNDEKKAINETTTAGIASIKADIDLQLSQLAKEHQKKINHMIEQESYNMNQQNLAALSDMFESFSSQITELESGYSEEHLKAVQLQTESIKATNTAKDTDKLEAQLTQEKILSTQLQADLSKKMQTSEEFNRELTLKTTELEQANAKIKDLTDSIAAGRDTEQHRELVAALAPRDNGQANLKHGFVKGMLTSAGIILALGGIGLGAYQVQTVEAKADTAASEAKAAKESYSKKEQQLVLQSSKKDTAKTQSQSSTATTTSNATDTTSYAALDQDVANNSLKVYYQSFDNKDLGTNARVLAVGKLLIASGNVTGAKQLATANPEHSSDLWMAIGQAQVGK